MKSLSLAILVTGLMATSSVSQDLKTIEGSWIAEVSYFSAFDGYGEASMTMKWETGGDRYRYTFSIPVEELHDFSNESDAPSGNREERSFSLEREAGTLSFEGSLMDQMGSGEFTFTANPEFLEEMSELGYKNISSDEQLKMTIYNVTTSFVRQLRAMDGSPES